MVTYSGLMSLLSSIYFWSVDSFSWLVYDINSCSGTMLIKLVMKVSRPLCIDNNSYRLCNFPVSVSAERVSSSKKLVSFNKSCKTKFVYPLEYSFNL